MLEDSDHPEFPFFSGTGFFVTFPPFDEIFFVTARHCIVRNGKVTGDIKIPYHPQQKGNEAIIFDKFLCIENPEDQELEDLLIYVVGDIPEDKKTVLAKRALRLQHQDDVTAILDYLIHGKGKVRTVGFPGNSKSIDYEKQSGVVRPRGFHGTLSGPSTIKNRYRIDDMNWKESELEGFSGSPILEFQFSHEGKIVPIPIGVLLTGSASQSYFLNINVVTDLIAAYLLQKYPKNIS